MTRKVTLSLALYSVYDELMRDLPGTLRKVREIGYEAVEFYGDYPNFDAKEIVSALAETGLELAGWQIEWKLLQPAELEKTIAFAKSVNLGTIIVPCLGGKPQIGHTPEEECLEVWQNYVGYMNILTQKLRPHGMRLGYHNHEHEFTTVYGGETVFDMMYRTLHPSTVMELDCGNVYGGKNDPAEVLQRYQSRPSYLHCKPFSKKLGYQTTLGSPDDDSDWTAILKAGMDGGAEQFMVECYTDQKNPYPEIESCLSGLKKALAAIR